MTTKFTIAYGMRPQPKIRKYYWRCYTTYSSLIGSGYCFTYKGAIRKANERPNYLIKELEKLQRKEEKETKRREKISGYYNVEKIEI